MLTWNNTDKSEWPEGEWTTEPDKAQWISETSFDCLIVRGPSGALCGYVGVPERHPLFGKHYNATDVSAHGGLTFAGRCSPNETPERGICHVAENAANETVWWFGFDCAHSGDTCPANSGFICFDSRYESYRSFDYVKREVESLAAQLVAANQVG